MTPHIVWQIGGPLFGGLLGFIAVMISDKLKISLFVVWPIVMVLGVFAYFLSYFLFAR